MKNITKTAVQQVDALKNGAISAVDLLEETISHANGLVADINPFALTLYDRARESAQNADRQLNEGTGGPLCGVPITIKDSQFLAGYPCANGSKTLRHFVPRETCRAVELLEQAGAVIVAKTTCPEFSLTGITASQLYGTTSNPWNLERTPGGSSGGAAAAVAAGMGTLSLGGDGGGSIRIPAAFCGIVGFKPSFGAIPRNPCFPSWYSLVSYGPMARTVADARLMYSVLNPKSSLTESASDLALDGYSIVASEDLGFAPVEDGVRRVFRNVVELLETAGAQITDDHPGLPSSVITWAVTASFDAADHARAKTYDPGHLTDTARAFIDFGESFTRENFDEAQQYRDVIRNAYRALFERNGTNILITPTLGCEAFPHGTIHPLQIGDTPIEYPWLDWAGFLYDANLAGLPACAIPMGLGDDGLPVSLQILGAEGTDHEVLQVAGAIESLIDWCSDIVLPEGQVSACA